jgi:hypothetical protein
MSYITKIITDDEKEDEITPFNHNIHPKDVTDYNPGYWRNPIEWIRIVLFKAPILLRVSFWIRFIYFIIMTLEL